MAGGLNMGSAGIALLGLLAVKGFQHRDEIGKALQGGLGSNGGTSGSGGLGGLLGGLGGSGGSTAGGGEGLGGLLGGLLGGAGASQRSGGSVLNEGLGGLLDRFRQSGHAEEADSWIAAGPNRAADPQHLEQALGEDVIEHLQAQTGLSRQELLERLSTNLPQTIDRLTPDGRLPTDDEADRYLPR